jgi:RND family efflux transporter MFP subunit
MKRRNVIAGAAVLASVLAVSAFTTQRPAAEAERSPSTPRVRAAGVSAAPSHTTAAFSARLEAADSSAVGFTLGGRIEEVRASVGDTVAAGDVLAVLDRRPVENALAEARAGLREVSSRLTQAERELRRARALGEATTEQELEQRRTAVERLEAQQQRARAAVAEAERRLEETHLVAPYPAEVVRRLAERGEVVEPGAPIVLLSGEGEALEAELSVPAHILSAIPETDAVRIAFPLSPDSGTIDGTITARTGHASGTTGLFEVTVGVPASTAADRGIRPGMMASVALPQRVAPEAVAVPPAAVSGAADGSPVVYVLRDGVVSERLVTLHGVHDGSVIVSGSVRPDDEVVVSGHYALINGATVEVAR